MDPRGYLCIILHGHLPYVRHPEFEEYLEEDWLYEAIVECYLPLIDRFNRLVEEGVDFRFSMTVSPPLASMLSDSLLKRRALRYIDRLLELVGKELDRTRHEPELHPVACFYNERLRRMRQLFAERLGGDIVWGLRRLQEQGVLEVITCAATHGLLPALQTVPKAVEAQVHLGAEAYRHFFGRDPRGIWLPECAYWPGLDELLMREGIRFFILDTHGVLHAEPRPVFGVYAPVYTPAGVAAFGRDAESSKQVWSSKEGYPGDFEYRDFYRDVGYDREFDYIRPYVQPTGLRKFTGIKYYRITGETDRKLAYRPDRALEKVAVHAGNFLFNREKQAEHLHGRLGRAPIIVAPYDAELYGHWWFEGPDFLYYFAKKVHYDSQVIRLTTPIEFIERFPAQQQVVPAASSWGDRGYYDVWVNGTNDWIYPHLHECGQRMVALANRHRSPGALVRRALNQCARELLLAQSSDWAFLISTGTAVEYASRRTRNHVARFLKLHDQVEGGSIDEAWLASLEGYDNLFPFIDYRVYAG